MQNVFNWFYTMTSNIVNWLFSMQIVNGVSVGMFMILAIMSGIAANAIVIKAKGL